ncbi:MAG: DUF3789 domain-containing protein [Ruminococcus flavefaciens]|nr:DUF3789 domain-containing protein [Ruminococcus flavefaciens]
MLNFLLGSFFGGTVGIVTMCLCVSAKEADKQNGFDE